jgi:hypothetical protein
MNNRPFPFAIWPLQKSDNEIVSKTRWTNPHDYSDEYNTQLSPKAESVFQKHAFLYPVLRDSRDYDSRGWWREQMMSGGKRKYRRLLANSKRSAAWMGKRMPRHDDETGGHFTDTYKKPNHPTFSTGSIYSNETTQGGTWKKTGQINASGRPMWTFSATAHNLSMHPPDQLRQYWRDSGEENEGHQLVMPSPQRPLQSPTV